MWSSRHSVEGCIQWWSSWSSHDTFLYCSDLLVSIVTESDFLDLYWGISKVAVSTSMCSTQPIISLELATIVFFFLEIDYDRGMNAEVWKKRLECRLLKCCVVLKLQIKKSNHSSCQEKQVEIQFSYQYLVTTLEIIKIAHYLYLLVPRTFKWEECWMLLP